MEPTNSVPNTRNKNDPVDDLANGLDATGTVRPETIDTWMATDHADGSTTVTGSPSKETFYVELSAMTKVTIAIEIVAIRRLLAESFTLVSVATDVFYLILGLSRRQKVVSSLPPLRALSRLTDWVPFPGVRKRQRKLLADEQAEIDQFRAEGRLALARWRSAWAWAHWVRYLISAPFVTLLNMVKGKVGI